MIEAAGGVAIAAHVDGPAGFLELAKTAKRRKAIYAAEAIRGFEVKLSREPPSGSATARSPDIRSVACIQGSDSYPARGSSHRIDAVGRRFTLMKLGELTIRALKQALADPNPSCQIHERPTTSTRGGNPRCFRYGVSSTDRFYASAQRSPP